VIDRDALRPAHLAEVVTPRGFTHLPPVPSTHGGRTRGEVRAYESSSAEGPHVWLVVRCHERLDPGRPEIEGIAHLTAEDAWRLAEQLVTLVLGHYQGWDGAEPVADLRPADRAYDVVSRRATEEDAP
jgi:hypothetical protein